MILNYQNNAIIGFFQSNSHDKELLDTLLALFVGNDIFSYLTLKLTFWQQVWPWIFKIILDMDCPVKITQNVVLQMFLALFVEKS